MRILLVSPYPPVRDGIAAYALQEVRRLVAEGHDVEVLSPGPSAAHHHLDLVGPRGALALARRVRRYDRLVVQFHPDVFYPVPASAGQHAAVSAALAVAFAAAHHTEVRVHEVDYSLGRRRAPAGPAFRAMWRAVDEIVVHTETERANFVEAFDVVPGKVSVAAHGASFIRRTTLDQAAARARLGIPAGQRTLLSIGFLQPHKGFDRVMRSFAAARLHQAGARLDVVGSVRVEEPDYVSHLTELRRLAEDIPGVTLHEGYVSDEAFDLWLVASDVVVLAYRTIWSSSVLERAVLYDRPVIATRVGALESQAPAGTVLVDDDVALTEAMRRAGDEHGAEADRSGADPWPVAPVDRQVLQDEVAARAARSRGHVPASAMPSAVPGARDAQSASRLAAAAGVSAPLRRLGPLQRAQPISGRPGSSTVKRLIQRLTAWQVDPLIAQVNALQRAAVETVDAQVAASLPGDGRDHGSTPYR